MEDKKAELKDLARKIYERNKEFERNKLNRMLVTIALYAVSNAFILYLFIGKSYDSFDIKALLVFTLISVIVAIFQYMLNITIFTHIITKGHEESEVLDAMKKRFYELQDEINTSSIFSRFKRGM